MTSLQTSGPLSQGDSTNEPWHVRVYIVRWTPASIAALRTVKEMEAEYFPPGSVVEVIDLLEEPAAGLQDKVLAIPTVVRVRPGPVRRIVGSLNDIPRALEVLGFSRA